MSTYNPDKFILININDRYFVFGGWGGSYSYGQSWKRSSGIVSIKKINDTYHVKTETDSIYVLPLPRIGLTSMMINLINSALKHDDLSKNQFIYDESEIIKIFSRFEENENEKETIN